jgi:hypothetical protein
LIDYIRAQGRVLFLNENDALDFIRYKMTVKLSVDKAGRVSGHDLESHKFDLAVEFRGQLSKLTEEVIPA